MNEQCCNSISQQVQGAVGLQVDMEERFCNIIKELGCTCVTISHRPALMAFHDQVLALDGEGGWSLHSGARAPQTPSPRPSTSSTPPKKVEPLVGMSGSVCLLMIVSPCGSARPLSRGDARSPPPPPPPPHPGCGKSVVLTLQCRACSS